MAQLALQYSALNHCATREAHQKAYFILEQLDNLIYRIQKSPKTKVKVVQHDKLKPYNSRTTLDNSWVFTRAKA